MDIGEFGGYWCMELCCAMAKLDTIRWWVRATVQSGCGEFGCGVLQYNFDGGWWCHNIFDIKRRFDPSISKYCVHGGIRRMWWGNGWLWAQGRAVP